MDDFPSYQPPWIGDFPEIFDEDGKRTQDGHDAGWLII